MKATICSALLVAALAGIAAGSNMRTGPVPLTVPPEPGGPSVATLSPVVLYDSESDVAQGWSYFSRDGRDSLKVRFKYSAPNDPALLEIRSVHGAPVGLNMIVPALTGVIDFEYRVLDQQGGPRFGVYAVPVQEMRANGPVEVGAKGVADPANARSRFRVRSHVPEDRSDGQWHAMRLEFDFRELGAVATIVAPRINEMPDASSGSGAIQFRHFRIIQGGDLRPRNQDLAHFP